MAKARTDPQVLNAERGERIATTGEQLGLFGPEGAPVPPAERRGAGRPAGAGNKLKSKLRDLMAARGYRDPAEQLAMLAGLDRPDLHPLAHAALLAAETGEDVAAVMREMRQAAGELMPYWHAKITPDVAVQGPVQVFVAGGQVVQPGPEQARDVTPQARRVAPPPMPGEMQRNQGLADGVVQGSDDGVRTE